MKTSTVGPAARHMPGALLGALALLSLACGETSEVWDTLPAGCPECGHPDTGGHGPEPGEKPLCPGEVPPTSEGCPTYPDEYCDSERSCGRLVLSQAHGDGYNQMSFDIAAMPDGGFVVTGAFIGWLDFAGDSEPLESAGGEDLFLVRFDGEGKALWARALGGPGSEEGLSVATDAAGNIAVTGYFNGTLQIGGKLLVSGGWEDVLTARYTPEGDLLWVNAAGSEEQQIGRGVAFDGAGNVVVTGVFWETLDFGGIPMMSGGWDDAFVAKLDANGVPLWSKRLGGVNTQDAWGLAIGPDGAVVISGLLLGALPCGNTTVPSGTDPDAFVVVLEPDGSCRWAKTLGGEGWQWSESVAVDREGNVIVGGGMTGPLHQDGHFLPNKGVADLFACKLDPLGEISWCKGFGAPWEQYEMSVALDMDDNIVLVGSFWGTIDFGGGTLASQGEADVFLAKLDKDGEHLWSKRAGGAAYQEASSVAVGPTGEIFVTGYFLGTMTLGDSTLSSEGPMTTDVFVLKLNP